MTQKTVTKEELAENLKNTLGLSTIICEEIVNEIFFELSQIACDGSSITIKNLGKFFTNKKPARPGLNVKTGQHVDVSPRTVMRFVPSRSFKAKL